MSKQKMLSLPVGATALVVNGKVTLFDPHDAGHLKWLAIMVGLMAEKLKDKNPKAVELYPPAFDEGIVRGELEAWAIANGFTKHQATTAWRLSCDVRTNPQDAAAGVIRLGFVAAYTNPRNMMARVDKLGLGAANLWQAYLKSRGLRLGMNTHAWLAARAQLPR